MKIVPAAPSDLEQAVDCFVDAFDGDSHVRYFFEGSSDVQSGLTHEFFEILMAVRLELQMPILIVKDERQVVGAAMGYNTHSHDWPPALEARWQRLLRRQEGLDDRLNAYDRASAEFKPKHPHYYLGAIGISRLAQGQGMGRRLTDAFSELSDADPLSEGVYLETFEEKNLEFYRKCGFEFIGAINLDRQTKAHCLFRPRKILEDQTLLA